MENFYDTTCQIVQAALLDSEGELSKEVESAMKAILQFAYEECNYDKLAFLSLCEDLFEQYLIEFDEMYKCQLKNSVEQ